MNVGIGHLKIKKKKKKLVGPIATFSKRNNRVYPKNATKNTYKRGYRLKLRLLKALL